jgi:DNA-binding NarL/FixJ family response regulator
MRVLIIDDHPLYRAGVRALLAGLNPDVIAVDAANVEEALQHSIENETFDLVLLDMNLPGVKRLDALRQVKTRFDSASVVVVSGEEDPALMLAAIDAGAAGFIPKSTDPEIAVHALRLVLAHGTYLPANALSGYVAASVQTASRSTVARELGARQRSVLTHMLQGKSNKVIARELNMAEGTVKAHLWSIYQLLGVASRTQAVCRVHDMGLLDELDH